MEKCTTIKLLHRTEISKTVLIKNIEEKNTNWWFYKEISKIFDRLKIEPKELCYYPDKIRRKLEEEYYEVNEIEQEIIEQIKVQYNLDIVNPLG